MDGADQYARLAAERDEYFTNRGYTRICNPGEQAAKALREEYRRLLDGATSEQEMQRFLTDPAHQCLIVDINPGLGCRWIKPHPSLGGRYEPDFITVRLDSGGLKWTLIELQHPQADLYLKTGTLPREFSAQLREGTHQISQWRKWITDRGVVAMAGEGFPLLDPHFLGVVVIGRAVAKMADQPPNGEGGLATLTNEGIWVKSYDSLGRGAGMTECGIDEHLVS